MVGHGPLKPSILVRVQVPQPTNFKERSDYKISALRASGRGASLFYILLMFYTYILKCSDDSYYVGSTNDLDRRLRQHNESKYGAHYTKIRRPVHLVYKETFKTMRESRRREYEIKSWKREKKIDLIENGCKKLRHS